MGYRCADPLQIAATPAATWTAVEVHRANALRKLDEASAAGLMGARKPRLRASD